ncbi:hypothetical protein [Deinococcus roseus]|uniref:Uncharacterized protein n=1 Tax=Deinococcus roseus TaxID=392414 RepID=A0ABQ2D1B5_9DEIO|nr:hypothetical protein [Deinococcus roseus]GGJ41471.1 hypothetical protein GCM10008938_29440 [Deinococcus roseus]
MNVTSWCLLLINALIWVPVYALFAALKRIPRLPEDREGKPRFGK